MVGKDSGYRSPLEGVGEVGIEAHCMVCIDSSMCRSQLVGVGTVGIKSHCIIGTTY